MVGTWIMMVCVLVHSTMNSLSTAMVHLFLRTMVCSGVRLLFLPIPIRNEVCFEAVASNMVNTDGADISAFLGGTHQFTYDPVAGEITLTGTGAWMGMPQLGTSAERKVPEASTTFSATLEEMDGYDLLHVSFDYPGVTYWDYHLCQL